MMPMKKKTFMATIIALGFLLSITGLQFVNITEANPFSHIVPFPNPITDEPIINMTAPLNNAAIFTNSTVITFSVEMPHSWVYHYSYLNANIFVGEITSVLCILDGREVYHDSTFHGGYGSPPSTMILNYSQKIVSLSLGQHSVTILVVADTQYSPTSSEFDWTYYNMTTSIASNFAVSTPPSPTPTLAPTLTPTPTQIPAITETPTPSPSVAEFPAWAILPIAAVAAVVMVCFRKLRKS